MALIVRWWIGALLILFGPWLVAILAWSLVAR